MTGCIKDSPLNSKDCPFLQLKTHYQVSVCVFKARVLYIFVSRERVSGPGPFRLDFKKKRYLTARYIFYQVFLKGAEIKP